MADAFAHQPVVQLALQQAAQKFRLRFSGNFGVAAQFRPLLLADAKGERRAHAGNVGRCKTNRKRVTAYCGVFGKNTSADIPARSLSAPLLRRIFTPKTCFTRSSTVCTLRGV